MSKCRSTYSGSKFVEISRGPSVFLPKHFNIMDPLYDDNNIGRSVSLSSSYRIAAAIKRGNDVLSDILRKDDATLLDNFFKNTIRLYGKNSPRPDVELHVNLVTKFHYTISRPPIFTPQQLYHLQQQYLFRQHNMLRRPSDEDVRVTNHEYINRDFYRWPNVTPIINPMMPPFNMSPAILPQSAVALPQPSQNVPFLLPQQFNVNVNPNFSRSMTPTMQPISQQIHSNRPRSSSMESSRDDRYVSYIPPNVRFFNAPFGSPQFNPVLPASSQYIPPITPVSSQSNSDNRSVDQPSPRNYALGTPQSLNPLIFRPPQPKYFNHPMMVGPKYFVFPQGMTPATVTPTTESVPNASIEPDLKSEARSSSFKLDVSDISSPVISPIKIGVNVTNTFSFESDLDALSRGMNVIIEQLQNIRNMYANYFVRIHSLDLKS